MKNLYIMALAALLLAVPAVSSAATFHYVDVHGVVQNIEASSPSEALVLASLRGNVLHSGVKLAQGQLQAGENVGSIYNYVDIYGNIKSVVAASADAAFLLATDIHPQSGLLIVGPVSR